MEEKFNKLVNKIIIISKNEGLTVLSIKSYQKIKSIIIKRISLQTKNKIKIKFHSLVDRQNVIKADWEKNKYEINYIKRKSPFRVGWVMSPPESGGGHQNLFRFINFLQKKGYQNTVYLYSNLQDIDIEQSIINVKKFTNIKGVKFKSINSKIDKNLDLLFATGWETAYPVFNFKFKGLKFYFVQDFEPYFYPLGTEYILSENTYKFGFYGITAGNWLKNKLSNEYNMKCESYDFGADKKLYHVTNLKKRNGVFFYARPVTERRAFDLGIMALEIFHKKYPKVDIHLAGWDVSGYDIPFSYINHGSLKLNELNNIYNKCSTALVISLTNMSLLPLELLSSGIIPVMNKGENNQQVSDNKHIVYTEPNPHSLFKGLDDSFRINKNSGKSKILNASINPNTWNISLNKFEKIILKALTNVK